MTAPTAGVAPEDTVAPLCAVAPLAVAFWSTTVASATVDSPEYSSAPTPTSALAEAVTVIFGVVPAPAVIGADHTLISVWSEARKCSSSVNVSPAESVTLWAVGEFELHTPASTTSRSPADHSRARRDCQGGDVGGVG